METQYNRCIDGIKCEEDARNSMTVLWAGVVTSLIVGFIAGANVR
jgi:hypothetical protein